MYAVCLFFEMIKLLGEKHRKAGQQKPEKQTNELNENDEIRVKNKNMTKHILKIGSTKEKNESFLVIRSCGSPFFFVEPPLSIYMVLTHLLLGF